MFKLVIRVGKEFAYLIFKLIVGIKCYNKNYQA
jgi:hypothetical protein